MEDFEEMTSREFYDHSIEVLEAVTDQQIAEMVDLVNVLDHPAIHAVGSRIIALISARDDGKKFLSAQKAERAKGLKNGNVAAASMSIASNVITSWMIRRKSLVVMVDDRIVVDEDASAAPNPSNANAKRVPIFAKIVYKAKRPAKEFQLVQLLDTIGGMKQGSAIKLSVPHYVALHGAISTDLSETARYDPQARKFIEMNQLAPSPNTFVVSKANICARAFVSVVQHYMTLPDYKLVVDDADQASTFDNVAIDHLLYGAEDVVEPAVDGDQNSAASRAQYELLHAVIGRVGNIQHTAGQASGFVSRIMKRESSSPGSSSASKQAHASSVFGLLANAGSRGSGANSPSQQTSKTKFPNKPTPTIVPGSDDTKHLLEYYYPEKTTFHVDPKKYNPGHIVSRRSLLHWHDVCEMASKGIVDGGSAEDYEIAFSAADSPSCPPGLMSHATLVKLVNNAFDLKMSTKKFRENFNADLVKAGLNADNVLDFPSLLTIFRHYSANVIVDEEGVGTMEDDSLMHLEHYLVEIGILADPPRDSEGRSLEIQQRKDYILQATVALIKPLEETMDAMVKNGSPVIFGSFGASQRNNGNMLPTHKVCDADRVGSSTRSVPEILALWSETNPNSTVISKQMTTYYQGQQDSRSKKKSAATTSPENLVGDDDIEAFIADRETQPFIDALEAALQAVLIKVSRLKRANILDHIETTAAEVTREIMENPIVVANGNIRASDVDAAARLSIVKKLKEEGNGCVDVKAETTMLSSTGGGVMPSRITLQGLQPEKNSGSVYQTVEGPKVDYTKAKLDWYCVFDTAVDLFGEISESDETASGDLIQWIITLITSPDWSARFTRHLMSKIRGPKEDVAAAAAGQDEMEHADEAAAIAHNRLVAVREMFGQSMDVDLEDVKSPSQMAALASNPMYRKMNNKNRNREKIIVEKNKFAKRAETHG